VAVSVLNARIAREKDRSMLAVMAGQSRFYGAAVIGPAAGVALIAGIVMVAVSGLGMPLWVIWGFAAIILSRALGATFIRRAADELMKLAPAAEQGNPLLPVLQRLATLNIINLLLLLSAVWVMVFKPTL
jgi:hypothetical protein